MPTFNPSPSPHLEPVYLFIDAEHLRKYYSEFARAWFGNEGGINFRTIKSQAHAVRLFYYDALDERKGNKESEAEFKARVGARKSEHAAVRALDGAHVRLGTVVGERRRQKQVDILLAVEMMNHAVRQNMRRAVLLTGDQDFKPVVDSLVLLGTFVEVWGADKHTSPALMDAADSHRLFSVTDYFNFSVNEVQAGRPFPEASITGNYVSGSYTGTLVAQGKAGPHQVVIPKLGEVFTAYVPIPDSTRVYELRHASYEDFKLYLALRFGETDKL